MIIFIFFILFVYPASAINIEVAVDETAFANVVDEIYLGVALDASLLKVDGLRKDINLKNARVKPLLNALSPCYLRFGGTSANHVFFNQPTDSLMALNYNPIRMLSESFFDDLVDITVSTNNRLLFGLNAELRYGKEWNPSDAIRIMEYCVKKNYGANIDWELGNEPNHISPSGLTPKQVANDILMLHKLLQQYPSLAKGSIVGPDVGWGGMENIKAVAENAGEVMRAYTLHPYYFDGKTSSLKDYIDPNNFIKLDRLLKRTRNALVNIKNNDKPLWFGESSTGYNSGTRGVGDRYVSAFLNLDKLGLSARNGVDVVIRQTFINGHYALVDFKTFDPFPDYWMYWAHHNLVGRGVLNVTWQNPKENPGIRIYAHCVKESNTKYKKGNVVVFALNVNETESYELDFSQTKLGGSIDSYVLVPENNDTLSKVVILNGIKLSLVNNDVPSFPQGVPVKQVVIQPLTYGYFVFKDVSLDVCKNIKF